MNMKVDEAISKYFCSKSKQKTIEKITEALRATGLKFYVGHGNIKVPNWVRDGKYGFGDDIPIYLVESDDIAVIEQREAWEIADMAESKKYYAAQYFVLNSVARALGKPLVVAQHYDAVTIGFHLDSWFIETIVSYGEARFNEAGGAEFIDLVRKVANERILYHGAPSALETVIHLLRANNFIYNVRESVVGFEILIDVSDVRTWRAAIHTIGEPKGFKSKRKVTTNMAFDSERNQLLAAVFGIISRFLGRPIYIVESHDGVRDIVIEFNELVWLAARLD